MNLNGIIPMAMRFAEPIANPTTVIGEYNTTSQQWTTPIAAASTVTPIETATGGTHDTDTDTAED